MLGCQKLTELRDKIICNADLMPVGECSDNPDSAQDVRARVKYALQGFLCLHIHDILLSCSASCA